MSSTRDTIVLRTVLAVLQPLVRLLLRHGVTYPQLAQALKPVFLAAAREELAAKGMAGTDSAITLLSGVHRRDVREYSRGAKAGTPAREAAAPLSLAGELVGRWLTEAAYTSAQGMPRPLQRSEFDALAAALSNDVRPRAMLDELLRLGSATVAEDGSVHLAANGFAPRQGFAEMAELMRANLADHAAAAAANLQGDANFLEQALYVDQLHPDSVEQVRAAARKAWQAAARQVMAQATSSFAHDQKHRNATERTHRARFGVYFYSETENKP
jgi:hypothetical protein